MRVRVSFWTRGKLYFLLAAVDKRVTIEFVASFSAGYRLKPAGGFDFSGVHVDRAPSKHPRTFRYVAVFDS